MAREYEKPSVATPLTIPQLVYCFLLILVSASVLLSTVSFRCSVFYNDYVKVFFSPALFAIHFIVNRNNKHPVPLYSYVLLLVSLSCYLCISDYLFRSTTSISNSGILFEIISIVLLLLLLILSNKDVVSVDPVSLLIATVHIIASWLWIQIISKGTSITAYSRKGGIVKSLDKNFSSTYIVIVCTIIVCILIVLMAIDYCKHKNIKLLAIKRKMTPHEGSTQNISAALSHSKSFETQLLTGKTSNNEHRETERIRREAEDAERKRKETQENERRLMEAVKAEEAERRRKEATEAEVWRRAAEEVERKRREAEEKERKRKVAEEAERKRKEAEEAERRRKETEEKEHKRKVTEEAERKRKGVEGKKMPGISFGKWLADYDYIQGLVGAHMCVGKVKMDFAEYFREIKERYPVRDVYVPQDDFDPAIEAKREGKYAYANMLYMNLTRDKGALSSNVVAAWIKVLACAGDVEDAILLGEYALNDRNAVRINGTAWMLLESNVTALKMLVARRDWQGLQQKIAQMSGSGSFISLEDIDVCQKAKAADAERQEAERKRKEAADAERRRREAEEAERKRKEAAEAERRRAEAERSAANMTPVSTFHTKVVGVTYRNSDGSDRQQIIRNLIQNGQLRVGTELQLIPEPTNPYDSNCIQVVTMNGLQIGNLSREVAANVAPAMKAGSVYKAQVSTLTGGGISYAAGVNIQITCYDRPSTPSRPSYTTARSSYSSPFPDDDAWLFDPTETIDDIARAEGFSIDDDGHWVPLRDDDEW